MSKLSRWLVHKATIEKCYDGRPDPFGAAVEQFQPYLPDLPSRLINTSPQSRPREIWTNQAQGVISADYNLFVETEVEITERDRVVAVKDENDRDIVTNMDIILTVERYARSGIREYTILYLKRRGI